MIWAMPIGAQPDAQGTRFRVWASAAQAVDVLLYDGDAAAAHPLQPEGDGYFSAHIAGVRPGARYAYRLDGGGAFPDPASRSQPDGVHAASAVVDPAAFGWGDARWQGPDAEQLVIYEVHVGAATAEGTFDSLIERLVDLAALGVTAVELMPVADFPGMRNWGYDGVSMFAPARAYGGPEALRRLVDAAHRHGLAVLLDVVYNHLGPDGNYLRQFSPAYFTDRHTTPWGAALNFDSAESAPVREFFIANACYWLHEYHIDGLRLDATHALHDDSDMHILAELAARVRATLPPERRVLLIAENEMNDPMLIRPSDAPVPGYGLDGVWADDFHHQLRVAIAGDREGYYMDYSGSAADIVATLRQGWFYTGQRSRYLDRPRGAPADGCPPHRFVYCIQNHDQIGNRALGDRLSHHVELAAYRAASALLLLAPQTPLLFMGQEWAASTPFLYFTDHAPELGRLVTAGRQAEFAQFTAFSGAQVPDPQAPDTFLASKLRWDEREQMPHAGVLRLYADLLRLRRQLPALHRPGGAVFQALDLGPATLALRYAGAVAADDLLLIVHLRGAGQLDLGLQAALMPPAGHCWAIALASEDPIYAGQARPAFDSDRNVISLITPCAVLLGAQRI